MLEERVGGEYSVVWVDDGGGHLWAWVDAEPELGLLAVVDRKRLKKEGARARAVPPPTALKTMKPWRPVRWSASLRRRSRAR